MECPACGCPPLALSTECSFCGAVLNPTVAKELVGWRHWLLIRDQGDPNLPRSYERIKRGQVARANGPEPLRLMSPHIGHVWLPSIELHTTGCANGLPHTEPMEDCGCGIYAFRERHAPLDMAYKNRRRDLGNIVVLGEVRLSGKVIPAEKGWRAQKARILRLYVSTEAGAVIPELQHEYPTITSITTTNFWAQPQARTAP